MNDNPIKNAYKDAVWNANRILYNDPTYAEANDNFERFQKDIPSDINKVKEEADLFIHEIKRIFKYKKGLKKLFTEKGREELFESLERKRKEEKIRKNNKMVEDEENFIQEAETAINNFVDETNNKDILSTSDKIRMSQIDMARKELERRKKDLEEIKKDFNKEEKKYETMNAVMGGKEYFDGLEQKKTKEEVNVDLKESNPFDALAIEQIKETSKELEVPNENNNPDYLKLLAARGEGIGEFRERYRVVKRNEHNYGISTISHGVLAALACVGVTYSLYKINPSFFENANSIIPDISGFIETAKHITEQIISDPSLSNVASILSQGPAQLGIFGLLAANQMAIAIKANKKRADNKFEADVMEEENPLYIKDDVESIARHM